MLGSIFRAKPHGWTLRIFYKTDKGKNVVLEFIKKLPKKHKAKALREIDLLEELGTKIKEPHVKKIEDKLWELRIQASPDISRIFYFIAEQKTIVLLHGFIKKTEKTPEREKNIARKRMIDYLRRKNNEL